VRRRRGEATEFAPIAYDWFALAHDLLLAMKAVELENGLRRKGSE
jgi:hypothetical protein